MWPAPLARHYALRVEIRASRGPHRARGRYPFFQVDAFAAEPFRGNPAAVVFLERWPETSWLQAVAAEMNLSETAFLVPAAEGFELRWLTPTTEVDLCGHATLASAVALWESGRAPEGLGISFLTRSGVLTAAPEGSLVHMSFPATPPQPAQAPPGLIEALGVAPRWVGRSRHDYLVEVADPKEVEGARPDLRRLRQVETRGVILTAGGGQGDFVSRFFAPAVGVDEDPVTGSAHCCLGPYWGARFGKEELLGVQISPRGGAVHVRLAGERAILGGEGVVVIAGELLA
jgi:PhzF family phenazine biosynthesis protein